MTNHGLDGYNQPGSMGSEWRFEVLYQFSVMFTWALIVGNFSFLWELSIYSQTELI